MSTITEYLEWRGDIPFGQVPCNEVDAYLLAKIGAPDLTGIVMEDGKGILLKDAYLQYFNRTDIDPDYLGRLNQHLLSRNLRHLADTERFGKLILSDYLQKHSEAMTEQISALTVSVPDGPTVITFRGTDDTIVGWKENFLMARHGAIPAQKDALEYLERMAEKYPGPLALAGHSKGGNLAVYAAVMAPENIRNRIVYVYNFDGPGFHPEFWTMPEAEGMKNRILNYTSQHAMVGVLLTQSSSPIICRSRRSGPLAHEAMNWDVMGASFLREEQIGAASMEFGKLVNRQVERMADEEIVRVIEQLFGALTSTGASTLTELTHQSAEQRLHILKEIGSDESIREFEKELAVLLFQDSRKLKGALKRHRSRGTR